MEERAVAAERARRQGGYVPLPRGGEGGERSSRLEEHEVAVELGVVANTEVPLVLALSRRRDDEAPNSTSIQLNRSCRVRGPQFAHDLR